MLLLQVISLNGNLKNSKLDSYQTILDKLKTFYCIGIGLYFYSTLNYQDEYKIQNKIFIWFTAVVRYIN